MTTIGFIDIHPNNPLCGKHLLSPDMEICQGEDLSAIHVYKRTGNDYTYDRTLSYPDQEALITIDEFYVSIPATVLDFRILHFPFSDEEKIQKATPLALHDLIAANPDEIVFDTVTLAETGAMIDVLVAYMKKDILQKLLDAFAQKNMEPRVVTSIDLQIIIHAVKQTGGKGISESISALLADPEQWDISHRIGAARMEVSNPVINLRSGPFAYQKDAGKTRRAIRMTIFLGVLLAVMIHAGFLSRTIIMKQETASIAKEIRTAYTGLFPADKKVIDELYQLKSHLLEIKDKNDILTGTDPLRLLFNLSQGMDAYVSYTDIQIEKGIIKIKAEARSMDDVSRVNAKLSRFLSDITISDIRPERGKVFFTVVSKGHIL